MRKSLILFLLIGGIALGFGIYNNLLRSGSLTPSNSQAFVDEQPLTAIGNTLSAISSSDKAKEPISFSMPALGVDNVIVESVGLDTENKMDVPRDSDNVGWYNLGAKPGQKGSVVMAGHLDKKTGEPAVFYHIKKLKPGDELKVTDSADKVFTYVVTQIKSYELSKFPLQEVFGSEDKARLNLITCEGTFDKNSDIYSHRLVVYSELKS